MKEGFGGAESLVIGFQERVWWLAVGFRRHIELVLAWCLKESVGGMGGVSGAEHLIASESVPPPKTLPPCHPVIVNPNHSIPLAMSCCMEHLPPMHEVGR